MEQVNLKGIIIHLTDLGQILKMRKEGTLDFVEKLPFDELEVERQGIYNVYYYHNDETFYAVWDRPLDGKEHNGALKLNEEQRDAIRSLANAYDLLFSAWSSDWEGPDNFGGTLSDLGVLPTLSVDEAAYELRELLEKYTQPSNLISEKGDENNESAKF